MADVCSICGKPALPAQGLNGATGDHWDCSARQKADVEAASVKLFGVKPSKRVRRHGPSAARIKVAAMLEKAISNYYGEPAVVDPNDFIFATGYWRSSQFSESYRWGVAFRMTNYNNLIGNVDSYARLGDCARYGVTLMAGESDLVYMLEAYHAKGQKNAQFSASEEKR